MDQQKAMEILTKQYKRQNEYIKHKYDRVSVVMPRGYKELIRNALNGGETLNGFINAAIENELKRRADHIPTAGGGSDACPF